MPFDNTLLPADTAPDLSKPSLEGLSWLLRHKEAWPPGQPGHRWDYSCRNTCAIGIARRQWPETVQPGCTALGIGISTGHFLFGPGAYFPIGDIHVTPVMVADRIDECRGR